MAMKKYVKALINLLLTVFILLAVIFLLPRAIIFFMPFVIGWIIALIASPPVRFLEEKLKIKRKISCAVVIILVIGLVVLAAYLIGGKLIRELLGFIEDLPELWASMEEDFSEIGNNLSGVYDRLPEDVQLTLNRIGENASGLAADLIGRLSSPTIEAVGDFAKQLPTIIIGIIMCLLSAYFFVAERDQFTAMLRSCMPNAVLLRYQIIKRSLFQAVGGYFKAQIRIEAWIYLLLVIGLVVLGVDYTLLIALGIAVLDFFPFFGTGTVMLPWALVKFLSADYKMTIGLLLTWGISQLVRQIIQPKIVGDSIGVPPIPTLFLLFIGYKLAGVFGMIIAVPIGIIFWTLYKEGAFDTTRNSIRILTAGLNRFRKLTPEDMEVVDVYHRECEEEIKRKQERKELSKETEAEEQDAEL
ncbi:MAG: sporulation integral membrane protein YtvI [Lachnospiraceae bacterium]|nr:sporulation integral membrane protein YtvI [Lachnospiraceae bacterium]